MEGIFLFPVSAWFLKLDAQTTPEIPVGRHEQDSTISRGDWDVPLGEQVAEIGDCLHMTGEEAWQGLPDFHAQKWVKVIKRLAVGVLMRNDRARDPFVAGGNLGS